MWLEIRLVRSRCCISLGSTVGPVCGPLQVRGACGRHVIVRINHILQKLSARMPPCVALIARRVTYAHSRSDQPRGVSGVVGPRRVGWWREHLCGRTNQRRWTAEGFVPPVVLTSQPLARRGLQHAPSRAQRRLLCLKKK